MDELQDLFDAQDRYCRYLRRYDMGFKSLAEKANEAFSSVYVPEPISRDAHNLLSLVKRQRGWNISDNEAVERLLCEEVDRHISNSKMLEDLAKSQ